MTLALVLTSDDNTEVRHYHNFEEAIHFCLDYMTSPMCDASEMLVIVRNDAVPESCRGDVLDRDSIKKFILFTKKNMQAHKFCIALEFHDNVDLSSLRNIVACVSRTCT